MKLSGLLLFFISATVFFTPVPGNALSPDEIMVVANLRVDESVSLAKYYMEKRHIPDENLIFLLAPDTEDCSREEYAEKVASQVRRQLVKKDPGGKINCLVTMYGVPLKIRSAGVSKTARQELDRLSEEKASLEAKLESRAVDAAGKILIAEQIEKLKNTLSGIKVHQDTAAALDSELALVLAAEYDTGAWISNPYFTASYQPTTHIDTDGVLMVSRLDGPTPESVRRMIDDSISAENTGLTGVAYMDARWKDPGEGQLSGYDQYDRSIHRAAVAIREKGTLPVVLEETSELFSPGQCKEAALYCGWYGLARYVDAFKWQVGAVGYHIASAECTTLREPGSQVWCKRMLEEGVTATIGPVGEPYVQSFPPPDIFFQYLTEGDLTLVECYFLSTPYLSWKQVLLGDPLYRPFLRFGEQQ
jgi:uncharacterized protein (TIGR03790 family)